MATAPRILIIDDEPDLTDLLAYNLKREGYEPIVASSGADGLRIAAADTPDLIILDVMMPPPDGLEVARRIRDDANLNSIPVIMLTAKSGESDEIAGLDAGADDYVTKPFSVRVLVKRVQTMLRRNAAANQAELSHGPITVNTDTHEAFIQGNQLTLTATEFKLLASLLSADGKVLSRAALIMRAMGPGVTITERTIDVHVTSIRKKLGPAADLIHTVRGVGYRMVEPQPTDA